MPAAGASTSCSGKLTLQLPLKGPQPLLGHHRIQTGLACRAVCTEHGRLMGDTPQL